ncbi:hypothetical protein [Bacillus cereus]|uniref:hypothetical protein n=1 Tax=Bacillus cereus TaxID=1396 RepID=UPI0020D26E26|nr:hypothetical protein [Bacillus cereus]MDA2214023.1 hypothetical protein [Bacillus cereus]MDA2225454.1 hypothetical protein [Bacillus cereus]
MINELKVGNVFSFWIPVNLGFARSMQVIEGEYLGQYNGIHLITHFDEDLCMHVVSELTTGYGITKSFKQAFAIEKVKRRIDKNKDRVDLWIKTANAKHGELNRIISINNKTPYCGRCKEEYKEKQIPDYYCEKCDRYSVMYE